MFEVHRDALLALLPHRYVRNIAANRIRGGVVGGICEALAAVGVYAYLFHEHLLKTGLLNSGTPGSGPPEDLRKVFVEFATGPFHALNFWFTPGAMLTMFFMFEGVIRAVSAGVSHDPFPSLPLWLLGAIHDKLDRKAAERRLAPPAPDQVETGKPGEAWDLRITAVRAKRDWHNHVTISYAGQVYEIASKTESQADDQPPYIYCLKKKERIGAFRGIVYYDPFEFWKNQ